MTNQMDLSQLTTQQLIDLLWVLKGTPQAQPLYQEYSRRLTKPPIQLDDPNWEAEVRTRLQAAFAKARTKREHLPISQPK